MRLRGLILLGAMVMAQFNLDDPSSRRCWFVDHVALKASPAWPGPFYLNRDKDFDGWLIWAPVLRGDRDAAARTVGFKTAKDCET